MTNEKTLHTDLSGSCERTLDGRAPTSERGADGGVKSQPDVRAAQAPQKVACATECPFCGAMMDSEADFCESCQRYVKSTVCSFCGTPMVDGETYCPECGNPRGSVVCPVCHTFNEFSFCKQCGTPLTDEARDLVAAMKGNQEYQQLMAVCDELQRLDKCLPFNSEADIEQEAANERLKRRVQELLQKDGLRIAHFVERPSPRMRAEELARKKTEQIALLNELLDKFAIKPTPSPAIARNYAMASKPAGVRLAWVCNYKHAMHSSPCGCAKPQLGGKWIILDKGSVEQLKDDNASNG